MTLKDITLGKRLWLAVLIPVVVAVSLAGSVITDLSSTYRRMSDIALASENIKVVGAIAHTLQVERGLSAGFLASGGKNGAVELVAARKASDEAVSRMQELRSALSRLGDNDIDNEVAGLAPKLEVLRQNRAQIDTLAMSGKQSFQAYTSTIAQLMDFARSLSLKGIDSQIAAELIAYTQLMQAKEMAGQERGSGNGIITAGKSELNQTLAFTRLAGAQEALLNNFVTLQPKELQSSYTSGLKVPSADTIELARSLILGSQGTGSLSDLDAKAWFAATTQRIEAMRSLENQSLSRLAEMAEQSARDAFSKLLVGAVLTLCGSIAMLLISTLLVGSLVKPLKVLTAVMRQLADGNLNAVQAGAERKDEVGDMARAVEVFRQAAIRNGELEAEAEANRRRSEAERVELQRRAEEDANDRLNRATSSLASGLKRLAAGDMVCEIHEEFAPQFEALRQDFNTSVSQLRDVLLAVGQSAAMVNGGSGEISSASDNLAKRTEQQAASLEETAAALEEITANVKMTSRRTVEARDLVLDARGKADRSGVVVDNAVKAMQRIEHASGQISQIISVIDEIAFQTNLLALNAGVEAARAGDAGKGFAVVAQEVRELAQRSANAAKEIKVLIGNSETAVNEGVKLVSDTGSGLSAIAEVVQSISGHMDAIASAAQEQSSGLAEVNTAVNHMDQATQQNAAMVEEMNAASAGLAHEAGNLAALLSQFRTAADIRQGFQNRAA
ncbi:methyl-accepting chemotaxis protein [Rhizobium sp. C4]|uniref:methyl-accepting chemotaxis protein n=1 Tax=Rhizobium sp. C4 TaxID=1349800 RepID=UPI001E57313A|nr:methyl-accepting chemotaxis protein [Rhizobium sp. C4]MCD2173077.1 methyl-accepting chemotaxis protein [Rhizobium sp. C4]